jgi:hypothetical protein
MKGGIVSGANDIGITDRRQGVTVLDETSSRGIDETTQRILLDAGVVHELGALESDTRRYLNCAALIDVMEFLWVYLALPGLAYLLFTRGHVALATAFAVGWLIVAVVHLVGAPFSWRDRQRGRALLRQLQDMHAILGSHPISTTRLQESLDQASAAGVVLDGSLLTLVGRMIASDATAFVPQPIDPRSPSSARIQSGV